MDNWLDFNFDETIHDFDYTRRAAASINRIIDSSEFSEMDADMIFKYLSEEMEIVLFPDYLKRYIYEKLEIDAPFRDIPNADYQEIISQSLADNHAPYSFKPTSTKKGAMIKLWLTQPSTKRSTVFILGFGLRMTVEEVSEFLTKVLKEENFNFSDPEETVYWYCFKNDLPYAAAADYLKQYGNMQPERFSEKKWTAMRQSPEMVLLSEQNLLLYLQLLKSGSISSEHEAKAFEQFNELYNRCCEIIADLYNNEEAYTGAQDEDHVWMPEEITPSDLEKMLCSGIPVNEKNNLQAMSASKFGSLFQNKRMSRQRISQIMSGKQEVDRFDLITLLFFIYAVTVEPDWPAERYIQYIDAVNELLADCGMLGIYPVNPYEAFILMCIVTDYPLDIYAQIWEMSYEE